MPLPLRPQQLLQPSIQVENNSSPFPVSFPEMQILLSPMHSTGDNIEENRPESSIPTVNETSGWSPETTQSDNTTSLFLGYAETYNELDTQPVSVLSPTDSGITFDESNNALYTTEQLYTDLLPVSNNSN
jgi:hypothetical protein